MIYNTYTYCSDFVEEMKGTENIVSALVGNTFKPCKKLKMPNESKDQLICNDFVNAVSTLLSGLDCQN